MIETIKYKGKWSIPNNDKWYSGTLKFNPENGAYLELFGTFNSFFDRKSMEIILGDTDKGEVTLVECFHTGTKSRNNGIIIGRYAPTFILEGHHFNLESEICYRHVSSRIFNSFQWFNKSGLTGNKEETESNFSISYIQPEPIYFRVNDTCSGKIAFIKATQQNTFHNEFSFKEQLHFSLDYIAKTKFKNIITDVKIIFSFISLMCYEQSYPISITLMDEDYCEEIQHRIYTKQIKCFYRNSFYQSEYKLRLPYEHIVKYKDIVEKFPFAFERWFKLFELYPLVMSHMLNTLKERNHFSEDTFLDTVKALEAYHRDTSDNARIPKKEYKKLIKTIIDSVSLNPDDLQWLRNKLQGNEPTFSYRIKNLINSNMNNFIKQAISDEKAFVRKVTDSRNYYTHLDKKGETKALKGIDLFEITVTLQGLLYSCIFKELGLSESEFVEGLKYHLAK